MGFEFSVRLSEEFRRFRAEWRKYASIIRNAAEEFFGENLKAVYVFGSTIGGDFRPLSDVDIAIVLKREVDEVTRARFRSVVRGLFGNLHPFEIYVLAQKEWEWYRRFVKRNFVEISRAVEHENNA